MKKTLPPRTLLGNSELRPAEIYYYKIARRPE